MVERYTIEVEVVGDNKLSGTMRQATTDVKDFTNAANKAATETGKVDSGMDKLGKTLDAAMGYFAASKLIDFGTEMVNLGRNVTATGAVFDQLAGKMGNAQEILASLRDVTGGAASDMDLMSGANMLMRLKVADNADELSKLIGYISRLKSSSDSMGSAIENFSLMLANQSVKRLDSFGLSAGRVQERLDALKEAGMSAEAAFKQATMEEMQRSVEELGSAADVSITSIAKLEARWDNFKNGLAGGMAGIVEQAATTVDMLAQIADAYLEQQQRIAADNEARYQTDIARGQILASGFNNPIEGFSGQNGQDSPADFFQMLSEAALQFERDNGRAVLSVEELKRALGANLQPGQEAAAQYYLSNRGGAQQALEQQQQAQAFSEYQARTRQQIADWRQIEANLQRDQQQQAENSARVQDMMDRYNMAGTVLNGIAQSPVNANGQDGYTQEQLHRAELMASAYNYAVTQAERLNKQGLISDEQLKAIKDYHGEINGMIRRVEYGAKTLTTVQDAIAKNLRDVATSAIDSFQATLRGTAFEAQIKSLQPQFNALFGDVRGRVGDTVLFSPEEVDRAHELNGQMQRLFEQASALHDQGLVSDASFERIKAAANEADQFAQGVERGAEAFKNLTLPQALGEGSGGMFGQIGDLVIKQLQDSGMSDSQIGEVTRALDLASGRQTTAGIELRDNVVPMLQDILESYGDDALVQAINGLSTALQNGARYNETPDQIAARLATATGYSYFGGGGSGGAGSVQINPGDTQYSLAARYGGSWQDYNYLRDANGYLQPGTYGGQGGGGALVPNSLFDNPAGFTGAVNSMNELATSSPQVADAMGTMKDALTDAEGVLDTMRGYIEEMTSGEKVVRMRLDVSYPPILDTLLGQNGVTPLQQTVQENGGNVPGGDPRSRVRTG